MLLTYCIFSQLAVIFLLDFLNRVIDEVINNDEGQKEVKIDLLWHCQIDCPIDIYNTEGTRARISEKDETQQDTKTTRQQDTKTTRQQDNKTTRHQQ